MHRPPVTISAPPARPATRAGAALTALAVTVLWSSSWVLIRIGLDDEALEPITFAGLRYGLAAALLLAWMGRSKSARATLADVVRRRRRQLVLLGLGFYALTQGAQFVAIDHQPAATTSLVLSLTPLAVAVASSRALGEAAERRQIAGALLVVAGAATYFAGDLGATAIGLVAAGVALASNAASALLGRHVNRGLDASPVAVTAASMTVGALVLLAVGLAVEGWPTLSATAVLIIVWLAIVNTAVAFTLWNAALRRLSAVESAGINNTMLVQIAFLAWIFLGEAPGAAGLVGIAVVSIGIYLTQRAALEPRGHR